MLSSPVAAPASPAGRRRPPGRSPSRCASSPRSALLGRQRGVPVPRRQRPALRRRRLGRAGSALAARRVFGAFVGPLALGAAAARDAARHPRRADRCRRPAPILLAALGRVRASARVFGVITFLGAFAARPVLGPGHLRRPAVAGRSGSASWRSPGCAVYRVLTGRCTRRAPPRRLPAYGPTVYGRPYPGQPMYPQPAPTSRARPSPATDSPRRPPVRRADRRDRVAGRAAAAGAGRAARSSTRPATRDAHRADADPARVDRRRRRRPGSMPTRGRRRRRRPGHAGRPGGDRLAVSPTEPRCSRPSAEPLAATARSADTARCGRPPRRTLRRCQIGRGAGDRLTPRCAGRCAGPRDGRTLDVTESAVLLARPRRGARRAARRGRPRSATPGSPRPAGRASSRTRSKVFIPLTRLCRDRCHYCTFATVPHRLPAPFLDRDEVLAIARAGRRAGLQGGAVHARRPARGALAGGPASGSTSAATTPRGLRAGVRDRGAGGDRAAAAPEPGRAVAGPSCSG